MAVVLALAVAILAWWQLRPLWRDLRGARSPGEALGYLWRPPGWRPGGGDTTEELRARAATPPAAADPPPTAILPLATP